MLKKKYRLKKNIAFSATFKLKNSKSNEFLTLYKGKPKDNDNIPTKVGIVVSKKVHKRAVKRNKIKRRLREIYTEAFKNKKIEKLQDALSVIFIVRAKALELDYSSLNESALNLMQSF